MRNFSAPIMGRKVCGRKFKFQFAPPIKVSETHFIDITGTGSTITEGKKLGWTCVAVGIFWMWGNNDEDDDGDDEEEDDDDEDDTGLCCLLAIAAEFLCNLGEFPTEKRRMRMIWYDMIWLRMRMIEDDMIADEDYMGEWKGRRSPLYCLRHRWKRQGFENDEIIQLYILQIHTDIRRWKE